MKQVTWIGRTAPSASCTYHFSKHIDRLSKPIDRHGTAGIHLLDEASQRLRTSFPEALVPGRPHRCAGHAVELAWRCRIPAVPIHHYIVQVVLSIWTQRRAVKL